jgi:leucyl-tRNA synthetase
LPQPIITTFLRVLAPFAPHIAEELWARLGETGLIVHAAWPTYDEALAADAVVEAPVQVNGKLRAVLQIDPAVDNAALQTLALQDERIMRYVNGKTVTRVIVTPNRLVNIIVGN